MHMPAAHIFNHKKTSKKKQKTKDKQLNKCENVLKKNNIEKHTLKNNPQKFPSKVFFNYIVNFF